MYDRITIENGRAYNQDITQNARSIFCNKNIERKLFNPLFHQVPKTVQYGGADKTARYTVLMVDPDAPDRSEHKQRWRRGFPNGSLSD